MVPWASFIEENKSMWAELEFRKVGGKVMYKDVVIME